MEKRMRTWGLIAGGLLILAACCPVLAKNGISVNAFQADLSLRAGYVLVPIGLALGGLAWLPQAWAMRLSLGLAVLALGIAVNYAWQGSHLNAMAWGTWVLLLAAGHGLVFASFRLLRQRQPK